MNFGNVVTFAIFVLALYYGAEEALAVRAAICREDCDSSDPNDVYCRMDKAACVANTWGQKAVAFTSTLACVLTTGGAGCPSLAVSSVTGQGPLEYGYNAINFATSG